MLFHRQSTVGSNLSDHEFELARYEDIDDDIGLFNNSYSKLRYGKRSNNPVAVDTVQEVDLSSNRWTWRFNFADRVDKLLGFIGSFIVITGVFFASHNPITPNGREQFMRTLRRSGPAYQLPQDENGNTKAQFTGWRMGALLNAILLGICLCIEIAMISTAFAMDKKASGSAYDGVLYRGECDVTKRWTTILSLLLNIVATLMIGSSNYMMQCLSAPPASVLRSEHEWGRSLHIGIMSTRKPLNWWLMGLTSVPVHLLFNSAFFSSLQTNNYGIAIVSADAFNLDTAQNCTSIANDTSTAFSWTSLACGMFMESSQWESLNAEECIQRYSDPLISQYSNVVLVSSLNASERMGRFALESPEKQADNIWGFALNFTFDGAREDLQHPESLIWNYPGFFGIFSAFDYKDWRDGYNVEFNITNVTYPFTDVPSWTCNSNHTSMCTLDAALMHAENWLITAAGIPVDRCLSEPTLGRYCQLEYSSKIIIVVIVCDVLKIIIISFTLFNTKEQPCITIGDAVAEFVKKPEACTKNRCLVDREEVEYRHSRSNFIRRQQKDQHTTTTPKLSPAEILSRVTEVRPIKWHHPGKRWYHAPSPWQWLLVLSLYVPILIGVCLLMIFAVYNIRRQGAGNLWTRGLASVDQNAMFNWTTFSGLDTGDKAFLLQVLLINTPQLLFSFLYYVFNGAFTTMHAAEEWTGFATKRKPLRVSDPESGQRSTYWLSLPWSYSIPLIATSSLLHWLLSRSLYLVRVNVIGANGQDQPDNKISACGFSVLMMLIVVLTLTLLAAVTVGFGRRKLKAAIPIVGVESAAISAACHHPKDPETEATQPLLWGVVKNPLNGDPGHCSFSSGHVDPLVEGEYYW